MTKSAPGANGFVFLLVFHYCKQMFNTNRVVNKDIPKKIVRLLQLLSLSTLGLFLNELSSRVPTTILLGFLVLLLLHGDGCLFFKIMLAIIQSIGFCYIFLTVRVSLGKKGAHRLFETIIPFKSGILLNKKLLYNLINVCFIITQFIISNYMSEVQHGY